MPYQQNQPSGWRALYMSAVNFLLKWLFAFGGKNAAKHSARLRYRLTGWIANKTIDFKSLRAQQMAVLCPVCGGTLKERNGKYGRFMGCSKYPNCKYTDKL